MKILLLTNMFPSDQAPNYGVFVKRTEELLSKDGHTITRVALTKKHSKLEKLLGYGLYTLTFFAKALFTKQDVIYVHYASQNAKLVNFVKKVKPSIPVILNVHGTDVLPQTAAQERYQPAVAELFNHLQHVIVPSSYYQEVIREKYHYNGPVTVFPSGGVDLNTFSPDGLKGEVQRKRLSISDEKFVIGYISRIDVMKGWDVLLEAIAILQKRNPQLFEGMHFIFAGSGALSLQFDEMVEELQLQDRITKLPMLTQQEMMETFNAMDAFCFPSYQESLGLVGIEAMACGVPLIASDIPGIRDYAKDKENAILFPKGDAEELASSIHTFVTMPIEQQLTYSENALRTAQQFDAEIVKQSLLSVFLEYETKTHERGLSIK